MRFHRTVTLYLLVAGLLAFTAVGSAQVNTATVYGTVTDPTGAVIPGAKVTLTHEGTGASQTRESNATGDVAFDFLRVGTYTLTIEAQGFKRYEDTAFELVAGQTVRTNFVLEVGSITETVEVTGAAPLVQTSQAEQLQTFENRKVQDLPLSRRNFSSLLQIGTGVTPVSGGTGNGVRMNGLGMNGTAYAVDGAESSSNPEGRSAGVYQGVNYIDVMSIEAIQEVQTVKGIVPAEYGNLIGGQVQLITRSGTNEWHGSLFENFQADNLNARNPFLSSKQPLTYNQFGGSIGGPIVKDKVFFYSVYEGYREKSFRQVDGDVPTQAHRDRLIAAQPDFADVLSVFPLPNQPVDPNAPCVPASESPTGEDLTDGCTGVFLAAGSNERRDNHVDIKGDIRLGDVSNLSLTYVRGRPSRFLPRIFLNGANDREWVTFQEKGVGTFTTGGADWTSETRFSYNLNDMERWDLFFRDNILQEEDETFDFRPPRFSTTLGWGGPGAELYLLEGYTYSISQKFSKHIGKHSFKFGGSYMRHCCIRTNPENPVMRYTSYDDMLTDVLTEVVPTFGSGKFKGRMYEIGFFAQDDWRVTDRLTFNIGLRYDFFSNMVAKPDGSGTSAFYNADGLLDANFNFGPIRDIDNPYEHDALNLGPRFGFAYKLNEEGKTVLRGGFGVLFSGQTAGMAWQSVGRQGVPFRTRFQKAEIADFGFRFSTPTKTMREIVAAESASGEVTNTFSFFNPDLPNPYAMHWNLGIQHTLARDLVFESAYVANGGRKLVMHRRANNVIRTGPLAGQRPNENLRITYYVDSSQTTSYNSWQTSLKKRYSNNFMGSLHYTWSKALANEGGDVGAYYQGDNSGGIVQDFNCIDCEWGPASGDVTHYMASEWVWDLPTFSGRAAAARHILGGWQVSGIIRAQTGTAFRIGQSSNIPASRPDYIGGDPILDNFSDTLQYLNTDAFALVPLDPVSRATIRPGNIGNGALRMPGRFNFDFSLGKNFQVTEKVRFRFRADMFNAFNHVNLSNLRTSINSSTFGRLRGTTGSRVIQLNARLTF